jgi:hypothetical protein
LIQASSNSSLICWHRVGENDNSVALDCFGDAVRFGVFMGFGDLEITGFSLSVSRFWADVLLDAVRSGS